MTGTPDLDAVRNLQPIAAFDQLLAHAQRYALEGWPVFFLGRAKRPVANCNACREAGDGHDREACPCLTCHGFYASTADPDRIKAMRKTVPDGMLALRTGAASGVVVVDIDPAHGGQVDPKLMPRTMCGKTGSDGWHLYYRHPGIRIPCSQSRVSEGVDIRGDDGYVVLPPSVHPQTRRAYEWAIGSDAIEMPPELITACLPPAPPVIAASAFKTNLTRAGNITSPSALLESLKAAVRSAPEGRRRTTLYGSARGAARMVAAGALSAADAFAELYDVGRAAGQSERETRTAIAGGFRDEGVSAP